MSKSYEQILQEHFQRYPLMQPQDLAKLLYQSEFGPRHLEQTPTAENLLREWPELPDAAAPLTVEPVGGGFSRLYLNRQYPQAIAIPLIDRLFHLTAQQSTGSLTGLEQRIASLLAVPAPQPPDLSLSSWLTNWQRQGYLPAHHSAAYRQAYQPHYRLLCSAYAGFFPALLACATLPAPNQHSAIVAIDGRCGSGKTSLAALIAQILPAGQCRIIHMDDFYLPPTQRAADWQQQPAGNLDLDRLQTEVLQTAAAGAPICYRPYSCQNAALGEPLRLPPAPLTILEGSYSLHPRLCAQYDYKIFLTSGPAEQTRRLQKREGDYFPNFVKLWIPLEEQYIQRFAIMNTADLLIETDDLF